MLIIKIRNKHTDENDYADYNFEVLVNTRTISKGEICGHKRSRGWKELVRMLVGDATKDFYDTLS